MTKNKNNVEVRREPGAQHRIYMRVIPEINGVFMNGTRKMKSYNFNREHYIQESF
ncbi:hypothetical protein [Peribacillus sp. V2I11]|uniref:hypothetical protein n=1 Tax=Peribacillus sp. V2I11 TaxID=3042277 RepID=UPI0027860DA7|nr:hypothetical protein [Peribacillus sp. V2I11]MDQ0884541.1 hypothetical protein [Peribacillus sp. V2I11]